jgi:hypothetical protein
VHREVRDRGEAGVAGLPGEVRCRTSRFARRHRDQPARGVDAVLAQRLGRERRGPQQQCRVCHHLDGPLDADLLEQPLALLVAHGHPGHHRDDLAHGTAVLGGRERPDAEGVPDGRDAVAVGGPHVPEVLGRLAVVEQPTAAEDEDVQPGDLLGDGVTPPPPRVDDPVGSVVVARVPLVAGEDHDLGGGHGLPQGGRHGGQHRLVAGVEPAVGTEHSDGRRPRAPVRVAAVRTGAPAPSG